MVPDLPSWVPDFSAPSAKSSGSLARRELIRVEVSGREFWDACPSESLPPTVSTTGEQRRKLCVRGYHLTNVCANACADCQHDHFDYMELLTIAKDAFHDAHDLDWLEQVAKTMSCCYKEEDPQRLKDAFQQTLIINVIMSSPVKKIAIRRS